MIAAFDVEIGIALVHLKYILYDISCNSEYRNDTFNMFCQISYILYKREPFQYYRNCSVDEAITSELWEESASSRTQRVCPISLVRNKSV